MVMCFETASGNIFMNIALRYKVEQAKAVAK